MVSRLVHSNVRTESNIDQYWSIFRHVNQDHQLPSEAMNNIRFEKFLGFVTAPQGAMSSSVYGNHYNKEGMLSSASGSSLGFHYANSVYYTTVVVEEEDDMKDLTEDDVWGSHYTSSAAMKDSYCLDHQEEASKFCHDNSFIIKKLSSDLIQRNFVSDDDEEDDDDDDDVLVTSTAANNHESNGNLVSTMNMVGNMDNEEKLMSSSHGVNTILMNKDPYIHEQLVTIHGHSDAHDSSSYSFITALDQEQVICGDAVTQFTSSPHHVNDSDNDNCLSITNVSDSSTTPVTISHGMLFNGPRSVPMDIVDTKVIWPKNCDDGDDDGDGDGDETMTKANSIGTDKDDISYNGYGGGSNIRVVPPHELLAKQGAKNGHATMTFSVTEGAGRTLKGREICKVRDAVWKQTGFPG